MDPAFDDLTIPGAALREGTFTNGDRQATITAFDGDSLSFEAPDPFRAIIVEGTRRAHLYRYPAGTIADADLVAPGGTDIERVSFCY